MYKMKRFIILIVATSTLVACNSQQSSETDNNTEVYQNRNSTATISQDGVPSKIIVERDANSQTIIRQSGGNTAVIQQSN